MNVEAQLALLGERTETLQRDVTEIKTNVGRIDAKLSTTAEKIAALEPKLDGLATSFDAKLDALTTSFDAKLDGLRASFDSKLDGLRASFDSKVDGLRASFDGKLNSFDAKLIALSAMLEAKSKAMEARLIRFLIVIVLGALTAAGGGSFVGARFFS